MRHDQQHTSARTARKRAPGQGEEHHQCQVPSELQQQGKRWVIGGDTSDGVQGCELLEGRRIVSNELKTKRGA